MAYTPSTPVGSGSGGSGKPKESSSGGVQASQTKARNRSGGGGGGGGGGGSNNTTPSSSSLNPDYQEALAKARAMGFRGIRAEVAAREYIQKGQTPPGATQEEKEGIKAQQVKEEQQAAQAAQKAQAKADQARYEENLYKTQALLGVSGQEAQGIVRPLLASGQEVANTRADIQRARAQRAQQVRTTERRTQALAGGQKRQVPTQQAQKRQVPTQQAQKRPLFPGITPAPGPEAISRKLYNPFPQAGKIIIEGQRKGGGYEEGVGNVITVADVEGYGKVAVVEDAQGRQRIISLPIVDGAVVESPLQAIVSAGGNIRIQEGPEGKNYVRVEGDPFGYEVITSRTPQGQERQVVKYRPAVDTLPSGTKASQALYRYASGIENPYVREPLKGLAQSRTVQYPGRTAAEVTAVTVGTAAALAVLPEAAAVGVVTIGGSILFGLATGTAAAQTILAPAGAKLRTATSQAVDIGVFYGAAKAGTTVYRGISQKPTTVESKIQYEAGLADAAMGEIRLSGAQKGTGVYASPRTGASLVEINIAGPQGRAITTIMAEEGGSQRSIQKGKSSFQEVPKVEPIELKPLGSSVVARGPSADAGFIEQRTTQAVGGSRETRGLFTVQTEKIIGKQVIIEKTYGTPTGAATRSVEVKPPLEVGKMSNEELKNLQLEEARNTFKLYEVGETGKVRVTERQYQDTRQTADVRVSQTTRVKTPKEFFTDIGSAIKTKARGVGDAVSDKVTRVREIFTPKKPKSEVTLTEEKPQKQTPTTTPESRPQVKITGEGKAIVEAKGEVVRRTVPVQTPRVASSVLVTRAAPPSFKVLPAKPSLSAQERTGRTLRTSGPQRAAQPQLQQPLLEERGPIQQPIQEPRLRTQPQQIVEPRQTQQPRPDQRIQEVQDLIFPPITPRLSSPGFGGFGPLPFGPAPAGAPQTRIYGSLGSFGGYRKPYKGVRAYTPSATAAAFSIYGERRKIGEVTGLGIRPLLREKKKRTPRV